MTCGAVNADATMFSAVSLRTPLTGTPVLAAGAVADSDGCTSETSSVPALVRPAVSSLPLGRSRLHVVSA